MMKTIVTGLLVLLLPLWAAAVKFRGGMMNAWGGDAVPAVTLTVMAVYLFQWITPDGEPGSPAAWESPIAKRIKITKCATMAG